MSAQEPKVAVLMGSKNDWTVMQAACDQLDALGIKNEARVISAHRTPQRHHDFVTEQAPAEGVKIFICGAGMAAHLAGVTAALTSSPVIGVPLEGGVMGGMESEVEMHTKDVLLESAYFRPSSIRKTAKNLNLHTEASHRFERGHSPVLLKEHVPHG